jgi:hypothetical protein
MLEAAKDDIKLYNEDQFKSIVDFDEFADRQYTTNRAANDSFKRLQDDVKELQQKNFTLD